MDLYLGFLRVAAFLQAIETRRMACLERIGMNRSRADVPIGVGQGSTLMGQPTALTTMMGVFRCW